MTAQPADEATTDKPGGERLTDAEPRFGGVVRGVYTDGNVNHVLQPVIGWLRMDLHDGKPITAERAQQAIDRMDAACDAEAAWLATRASTAQDEAGEVARLRAQVAAVEALAARLEDRSRGFSGIYAEADREHAADLRAALGQATGGER